ncbi:hypothetical protein ScPMuIL_016643 [Solemya velum]
MCIRGVKMLSSTKAMKMYTSYVVIAILATSWCSAIPKPDEHKKREINKHLKTDAKTFDQLTPDESREKLSLIVDKIDKDRDGYVTEEELIDWIQYVQKRYVITDTERMWKDHDVDDDSTLKWEPYQKRTYGYEDEPEEGSPTFSYKDMIERDRRRWEAADKNKDHLLSKEEFMDFMHPEEAEHMRDIVVQETIEDIDKDKDGFISLEEYIEDVYDEEDEDDEDEDEDEDENGHHEPEWVHSEREQFQTYRDKNKDGKLDHDEVRDWIIPEDYDHIEAETKHLIASSDQDKVGDMWPNHEEEEPEWVKSEREQFSTYRDRNKDGKMDNEEVKHWIIPPDYDHSQAEAKHLIFETDDDKDGKLTRDEILDKFELFVGSQATDFGEALTRHDEF